MSKTSTSQTTPKRLAMFATCFVALAAIATLYACSSAAKSSVMITLPSQAATGFEWTYQASPENVLKETNHETKALDNRAGGDMEDSFAFTAQKSGDVKLTFMLKRSWEGEGTEAETATYTFKVDGNNNITLVSKEGTLEKLPEPKIS